MQKKQTLEELSQAVGHSHPWVRQRLDAVPVPVSELIPGSTVVIADTTFWGRSYGVCVFRSPSLKKNIWWT